MPNPTLADMASRTRPMAEGKRWTPKAKFHPGGEKGKLHREMGIPEGKKIPADKLAAARHSSNPHIQHMANFAHTMSGFSH